MKKRMTRQGKFTRPVASLIKLPDVLARLDERLAVLVEGAAMLALLAYELAGLALGYIRISICACRYKARF